MASGFRLIDTELGWKTDAHELWDIVNLEFGHRSDWALRAELQFDQQRMADLRAHEVISFRVHDEGELLDYWTQRSLEGVPVGTFYQIGKSAYLAELSLGVSALATPLKHFLVCGRDTCLEVLSRGPPKITLR